MTVLESWGVIGLSVVACGLYALAAIKIAEWIALGMDARAAERQRQAELRYARPVAPGIGHRKVS